MAWSNKKSLSNNGSSLLSRCLKGLALKLRFESIYFRLVID